MFGKLLTDPSAKVDRATNLLQVSCRECCAEVEKTRPEVKRVLHWFNPLGEMVATEWEGVRVTTGGLGTYEVLRRFGALDARP
jgi:hypothetical protein